SYRFPPMDQAQCSGPTPRLGDHVQCTGSPRPPTPALTRSIRSDFSFPLPAPEDTVNLAAGAGSPNHLRRHRHRISPSPLLLDRSPSWQPLVPHSAASAFSPPHPDWPSPAPASPPRPHLSTASTAPP